MTSTSKGSTAGPKISGHLELLYPSNYIKAADLRGKDVPVVIDHLRWENLIMAGGKRDKKAAVVMRSVGGQLLERTWIIGITVLREIGHTVGTPNTTEWSGKRITLYPTTCRGKEGKTVECIRVRGRPSTSRDEPPEEMMAHVEVKDFVDEAEGVDAEGAPT